MILGVRHATRYQYRTPVNLGAHTVHLQARPLPWHRVLSSGLSVSPAPGHRHQRVIGNLFLILAPHVRATGHGEVILSPFDCIMTNITVVEPDLVYVDAPYHDTGLTAVLDALGAQSPPLVVCEHHRAAMLPDAVGGLERVREATYGTTRLTFFRRVAAADAADDALDQRERG